MEIPPDWAFPLLKDFPGGDTSRQRIQGGLALKHGRSVSLGAPESRERMMETKGGRERQGRPAQMFLT